MNCPLPLEIIRNTLNTNNVVVAEIRNGIGKQVYTMNTSNGIYMLYIWLPPYLGTLTENKTPSVEYLFSDGFDLFQHNTYLLTNIGIRVPKIFATGYFKDSDFNYAVVEYFDGKNIDQFRQQGGNITDIADKILEMLQKMAKQKRNWYGSDLLLTPNSISSTELVYNFYSQELNIASELNTDVKLLQQNIINLMQSKLDLITDSENIYSLIHGEITPPHVFVLNDGTIGLVDIEGVKYFDPEYDWAVINMMYNRKIKLPKSINHKKLNFYVLCLKIGYLSVSIDYLTNIDNNNTFFKELKDSTFQDIKLMISNM